MSDMSEKAKVAQRLYKREWDKRNKEKVTKYNREWRSKAENKEKLRKYRHDYWERKAQELGL